MVCTCASRILSFGDCIRDASLNVDCNVSWSHLIIKKKKEGKIQ